MTTSISLHILRPYVNLRHHLIIGSSHWEFEDRLRGYLEAIRILHNMHYRHPADVREFYPPNTTAVSINPILVFY